MRFQTTLMIITFLLKTLIIVSHVIVSNHCNDQTPLTRHKTILKYYLPYQIPDINETYLSFSSMLKKNHALSELHKFPTAFFPFNVYDI